MAGLSFYKFLFKRYLIVILIMVIILIPITRLGIINIILATVPDNCFFAIVVVVAAA